MLKVNNKVIEPGHFPDGTLLLKEYVEKEFENGRSARITWHFENNEELLTLIFLTRHMQSHGIEKIHLDMPYIPNARQDRVKTSEDVFTLKYFSEVINSLHFASVTVLDPHSSVSEALIDKIVTKTPEKYIEKVIEEIGTENLLMFYPDEGAMKRYSSMTNRPYAFGIKKRDWSTGKINGLDVSGETNLINGSRILIVDDICSRGGTFYHSAKKLKELGAAKIYLFVSHCENTIFSGEVLTSGLVERVFATNSILMLGEKNTNMIEVFDYE